MSNPPAIRDFAAWINLQPPGPFKLIVIGEVETNRGNLVPKLTLAEPQGINPSILILDLTIVDMGGLGTQDVSFRPVRYEQPADAGQYAQVSIRWEGEILQTLGVGAAH